MFETANSLDYALVGLYFTLIVCVGVYAAKRNRDSVEYFSASAQVPWLLAGMSNWVSGFSAFMFVAAAGFTYQHGIGAVLIFTMPVWSYLVGYFYFARQWRRARLSSPLQFLTRRFSPSTTYFYSVTAIIPAIVGIGQGLYIVCIFVSTALGFNNLQVSVAGVEISGFQLAIMITGVVMILYTVAGGLWAAVLSDGVQGVIIGVMSVIILPLSYAHLGGNDIGAGIARLLREAPPDYFRLTGQAASPWFLAGYAVSMLLGYNVAWHLVQRYHSVPDERGARKMALLCAGLSLIGPLLWILPVMAARVIFPDMKALWPQFSNPAEASFVSLALLLLPHGMIGFVISAILSATLGQANDAFNWLAATTTRDVYRPLYRRVRASEPSEQHLLRIARVTMAAVGVLGIMVAFYIPRFGGAFQFALHYYSLNSAFLMPVLLGLVFRRTPWWSGMVACSAALTVAITLMVLGVWEEHAYARNMISEAVVASLVFFASSFWFKRDDPRHAELLKLEADLATPVIAENSSRAGAYQVYSVIAFVTFVLGAVLALCTLLPSAARAPAWINLVAGGLLILIGLGIRRLARDPRTQPAPKS
jgi:solute:Na+ symporter, SSS family